MEAGTETVAEILHELAEALQATGGYLSALRQTNATAGSAELSAEVIERALSQWARAQHAMRELRTEFGTPTAGTGG